VTARGWLILLVLALVFAGGFLAWTRLEGGAPEVEMAEPAAAIVVGAAGRDVELLLRDPGSGVRRVRAVLAHAGGEADLMEQAYPGNLWSGGNAGGEERVAIRIDPKALGLADGEAFLRVVVSDWSLRDNRTSLELPVAVDRRPPRLAVESGLTYVTTGGAGAVVYGVSETPSRSGVLVGDVFFRGHPLGGANRFAAIFAVPSDAPGEPRVRVVAEDAAGNRSEASWPAVVKPRTFPRAEVALPASFLDTKVRDLAAAVGLAVDDPEAAFREINTRVRAENEARIRELVGDSAPEPLWEGAFQQLENSQVTSRFAERRDYVVGGQKNSEATHFGYDLASTQAAPVTATAAGRVLFADELGIYGNCVLLDHGLGVSSLYGHLSRIDVAAGDRVEQGQALGLSGATGLAGGDHLHFAILVGGTYVDPLEWWDAEWMETHVDERVRPQLAREAPGQRSGREPGAGSQAGDFPASRAP
jgi:murein DD-endopeptidase MepM/ murein hydrolase activator NlpD